MLVIGLVAVIGTLALAFDEGNVLGVRASVALFMATAVAWAILLW